MTRREKNVFIHTIINKAIALLDVETEIVYLRIQHPELFSIPQPAESFLHWIGNAVDLLELAIALHKLKLIKRPTGQFATFADIVAGIERLFNIKIPNIYDRKSKTLTRKKNASPLLERLLYIYRNEVIKTFQ